MDAPPPILPTRTLPYSNTYGSAPMANDLQHLKTLAICHWVWGGLTCLLSCIFIFHIVMGVMMLNGQFQGNQPMQNGQAFPGRMIGTIFVVAGSAAVLIGWTIGLLTVYSGFCLHQQKRRIFSIIIAGINCISIPIGTTLGVFTFIVLGRASVKALYDQKTAETMK